jgi:hypothetical protein
MPHHQRVAAVLVAGALTPVVAYADSVYLKTGQTFEGVEAVVSGDTVSIELEIGRLRLPMSKVERIDEVNSTLGEYREREGRLGQEREDAAGWAELARWARANDFDQGAQKAALVAARLDPALPELAPVMAGIGYEFDDKAHEWVPYADAMRRKGLVEDGGDWITPEEKRDRSQARVETVANEPKSRADDHLDKALDILAEAVKKPDAPATTVVVEAGGFGGYGGGFYPGFYPGFGAGFGGGLIDPGTLIPGAIIRSDIHAAWSAMAVRQPASFIPLHSNTAPRHIHPITRRFTR